MPTTLVYYSRPALLLDRYPNAAAAFSLRKLRGSYTGSCIRVRRASDNAEQDIGFVGTDLDTAALTSFCTGTDGFVTTWYDQSSTNNATQGTAASQPKIYDSATGVVLLNGKPALNFDGINDRLFTANLPKTQPLTFSAVFAFNAIQAFASILSDGNSIVIGNDGSSPRKFRIFAGVSLLGNNATTSQTHLFGIANASSSELRVNSVSTTGNAGTGVSNLNVGIGDRSAGGNLSNAKIQQAIIWPVNQSANSANIDSIINSYYQIY